MTTPTLTAPVGGGGNRQICPEGMHIARCYQIIDLGTTEQGGNFPGKKRKVQFLFETPLETAVFNEEYGEQPYYVRAMYTLSMHEKAILRRDVMSWVGRSMTDKEAQSFNIFNLLGKPCMVNVVHATKGENTYANIKAITPLPKGMSCPDAINEQLVFTASIPDMEVFKKLPEFIQDKIKESDEFVMYMESNMEQQTAPTPKPQAQVETVKQDANDLPWELTDEEDPF